MELSTNAWRRWAKRVKTESRDLWQLALLPAIAACMPWPLAFKVLRRLVRLFKPYDETSQIALAQAVQRGWVGDRAHWMLVRRLVSVVDHADFYLSRTRSDAWMAKHVDVQGQWPAPGQAGVLLTFHWGAGMWGLRHARASGLKVHALVAAIEGAHFADRRVLLAYAKARTAEVARALGTNTLDATASPRPMLQALRNGEQVVAAIDVPSDQVATSGDVALLGTKARMPKALLRLAIDKELPVTVYLTGLRTSDGRRSLQIHQLGVHTDLDALTSEVFAYLDKAIREDPPAWHFWSEAPRFFDTH
jgi:phosphatidylinositol dimannoside acyltransferase